jgi:hypothetical protein
MTRFGYTTDEKARIRIGMQCPECFGAQTEPRSNNPFERHLFRCADCGAQWFASAPQFQSAQAAT